MLDLSGFVAETNATHVFAVEGGVVSTPRTVACPEGITRAAVLELCQSHGVPCLVRDLSLAEVHRADEVFCTGTLGELVPVVRVDAARIGDGSVGPVTRRLAALFAELTRTAGEPVV
jgi:branched-chain amino acid aminotransferase